ncbi:MAG: NADH-quinone oxidoreductase subunit L [Nitrospirae bacterium]|nr:NADH-quinone oxidoreductase subunit L [Nitrospirota bacterium]
MKEIIQNYGYLIVIFPLLGALANGLLGRMMQKRYGEMPIGIIACASIFFSFIFSIIAFLSVVSMQNNLVIINNLFNWISIGYLKTDISFLFDPLSVVMMLIITGVGFLIHLYSVFYMKGDPGFYRYFAYLNLFIFSMLVLVLADNMLFMFIGWEGVGLCSYLLIGFWYEDMKNAVAGNKAFIVNRVGDLGFLLGIFLLFSLLAEQLSAGGALSLANGNSSILSFSFLAENVHLLGGINIFGMSAVTVICLCLFAGATGKSAQIPLYVWLPDAMAGPTPVSALIHAATMVTAGVYMIARLSFLFSMSSTALGVIAVTGAATALLAASLGCVQNDIKKVLAYSTISQLGYMFLAMGVGAYSAGIFHLMTHAFFKACLFLGAGSVILALHHEQDITRMGGLRRFMPMTFITFIIAAFAISGLPPFSGFFSKDEILWSAWSSSNGHPLLWFAGFLTAGMTSFYMTRLAMLTFFGENRSGLIIKESPFLVTAPLMILAFFSLFAGFTGVPEALGGNNMFSHFLDPVFGIQGGAAHHDTMEYVLMSASVLIVIAGAGLGYLLYGHRPQLARILPEKFRHLHKLLYNKYFIDEIYDAVFVSGTKMFASFISAFDKYVIDLIVNIFGFVLRIEAMIIGWFDLHFIDKAVDLIAEFTLSAGSGARKIQTGRIQAYVMLMLFAVTLGILYRLIF